MPSINQTLEQRPNREMFKQRLTHLRNQASSVKVFTMQHLELADYVAQLHLIWSFCDRMRTQLDLEDGTL